LSFVKHSPCLHFEYREVIKLRIIRKILLIPSSSPLKSLIEQSQRHYSQILFLEKHEFVVKSFFASYQSSNIAQTSNIERPLARRYKTLDSFIHRHQLHFQTPTEATMKFLAVVAVLLACCHTQAAITRPDQVLAKLNEIEEKVFDYQGELKHNVTQFRAMTSLLINDMYNYTLGVIESSVEEISASDIVIRAELEAETQSACITNLNNFIDQIIELSGYAISNCIIVSDNTTFAETKTYFQFLDEFEQRVNTLAQLIVNALIGRNVFTQSDEIIARVEELFDAKVSEYDDELDELLNKINEWYLQWIGEVTSVEACFGSIGTSIHAGIGAVKAQLPICRIFGGRGARSLSAVPLNAKDFFPQLKLE